MAVFRHYVKGQGAELDAESEKMEPFTVDDILEVLRPAAIRLVEIYKEAIRNTFAQRSGSLAESIDFDDNTIGKDYAYITVKPFGKHKGGRYQRHSRAGAQSARYAKHNRHPERHDLKNEELAYLLEYGAPRISPGYHWMETAYEESEEEIQDIVEAEYDKLLKKKGLI